MVSGTPVPTEPSLVTSLPVLTPDDEKSNGLRGALEALETALATPLVPGEHVAWTEALAEKWTAAVPLIRQRLEEHETQYAEMLEVDQEIFARVDLLRQEDQAIATDLDGLEPIFARLQAKTPVAERDEARTERDRQAMVDGGIALVVRVRKHDIALQTWFAEAFNRDRGPVD
jgi:hypothetical protein